VPPAEALTASRSVIVCASVIDALSFWCAGFRNVTALAGLDGHVDEHAAAFAKAGIAQVMLAFRRSPEGDRAAEKVAVRFGEAGLECFRVVFPKGLDANDFLLKSPGGFEALLRQAEWLGKGKAKTAEADAPTPAASSEPTIETADEALVDAATAQAAVPTASQIADSHEDNAPPSNVPPLAAPSVPPSPAPLVSPRSATSTDEVTLMLGDRQWRIRGLAKNAGLEALKVNRSRGRWTGASTTAPKRGSSSVRATRTSAAPNRRTAGASAIGAITDRAWSARPCFAVKSCRRHHSDPRHPVKFES
jgi:hypothetical protein